MYSYEERIRTVKLYIKLGNRTNDTKSFNNTGQGCWRLGNRL